MFPSSIFQRTATVTRFIERNLVDLIKLDEQVKIGKGKYKGDVTLDRLPYDSAIPKAYSANTTLEAYKQKKHNWVPIVKGQIIYGTYPVLEAVRAERRHIHKLYFKRNLTIGREEQNRKEVLDEILVLAKSKKIKARELQLSQLDVLCEYQIHNGVCIDAKPLLFEKLKMTELVSLDSLLFLDNVLDTFNIGAITRSCVFFGLAGIVMSNTGGPKSITAAMSRASVGAIEYFPLYKVPNTESFFKEAKKSGYVIIGTFDESSAAKREVRNVVSIHDLKFQDYWKKFILILGNEHNGISEAALGFCDHIVCIPKFKSKCNPTLNSLNVSATTAILLYQIQIKMRNGEIG